MVKFWVRWRWLGLDQREVASAAPRAAARAHPRGVVRECPRFVTLGPKEGCPWTTAVDVRGQKYNHNVAWWGFLTSVPHQTSKKSRGSFPQTIGSRVTHVYGTERQTTIRRTCHGSQYTSDNTNPQTTNQCKPAPIPDPRIPTPCRKVTRTDERRMRRGGLLRCVPVPPHSSRAAQTWTRR